MPRFDTRLYSTRLARSLRSNMTPEEVVVWEMLRWDFDQKFRRQAPLGPYIVDFVCFSHRLIVELDGVQHLDSVRDERRDAHLRSLGFEILRFWNSEVLGELEMVGDTIAAALEDSGNRHVRARRVRRSDPPPPAPAEPGTTP